MKLSQFNFPLPTQLIAQTPPERRGESRLLIALEDSCIDTDFSSFTDYFQANDVLVLNNTQVMKARLSGFKASGGRVEVLIERILNDYTAIALIKASKSPTPNTLLHFKHGLVAKVLSRTADFFTLEFSAELTSSLESQGCLPLPPYISHMAGELDEERYQTIFASQQGAVAAPTAGLHFTEAILTKLRQKGVEIVEITLHVGAGTFQPVRTQEIEQHQMHFERYFISEKAQDKLNKALEQRRSICAVGTTSLRALESAAYEGRITNPAGETNLFIKPGYSFKVVDRLLTNFHLPKSSLLILVSAFSGIEKIQYLYQHAIKQQYRFFSYGDCMLLSRAQTHRGAGVRL
ncbi:MAG: tRNA preQ1(34) S-adenosylmethionine ribosyltransferase-isomerase QueA [Neisseriaceae bacterium]